MKLERFRLEIAVKRAYEVSYLKNSAECCRTAVIVQFLDFPEIILYPVGHVSLSSNTHDKKDIQYGVFHKAEFVLEEGIGSSIFPTQCFCTLAEFMTTDKARTVGRWTTVCEFHISPLSASGVSHESSALFSSFQTLAVRNRRGEHVGWVEMSSRLTQMTCPSPMMLSPSTGIKGANSGWGQEEVQGESTSKVIGPSISFDSSSRTPEKYFPQMNASALGIANERLGSNQNNDSTDTGPAARAGVPSLERTALPAQTNTNENKMERTDHSGTRMGKRSKTSGKTFRLVVKRKEISENALPESSTSAVVVATSTIKAPTASVPRVGNTSVHLPVGFSPSGEEVKLRQESVLRGKHGASISSLPTDGSNASSALVSSSSLSQSTAPIPIPSPLPPTVSPPYLALHVPQGSSPVISGTSLAAGSSDLPLPFAAAVGSSLIPRESKNLLSMLQCDILYQLHAICNTIAIALTDEKNSVLCTKPLPTEPGATLIRFRHTIEALVSQLLRKMNILVQLVYHLISQQSLPASQQQQKNPKVVSQTPASLHSDVSNLSHTTGLRFPFIDGTLGRPSLHTEALSLSQGSIGAFLLYDVLFQLQGGEGHIMRLLEKHGSILEKCGPSLEPNVQTHCAGVEHLVHELMKQVNVLIQLALSDSYGPACNTSKRVRKQNKKEEQKRNAPSSEKHLIPSSSSLRSISVASSRVSSSLSSSSSSSVRSISSRLTSLPSPTPQEVNSPTTASTLPSSHYSDRGLSSTLHLPSSSSPSSIPSLKVAALSPTPASPPTIGVKENRHSSSHCSSSQAGPDQLYASQGDTHRSTHQEVKTEVQSHPTSSPPSPPSVLAPHLSSASAPPPVASPSSSRPLSNSLRNVLESFTFCSSLSAPSSSTGKVKDESPVDPHQRPPSPTYSSDDDFTSSSSSRSGRYSNSHRYKRSNSGSSSSSSRRSGIQPPPPASSHVENLPSPSPLSTAHPPAPVYTSPAASPFNTPMIPFPSTSVPNSPSFVSSVALTVTPPVPSMSTSAVPLSIPSSAFLSPEVSARDPSGFSQYSTTHPAEAASGNLDLRSSPGSRVSPFSPGSISAVPSATSLSFSGGHSVPFPTPAKASFVPQANPAESYSQAGQSSTIVRGEEI